MNRRLFLARTAIGIATSALSTASLASPLGHNNPAVMLHRALVRRGAVIEAPLPEDIDCHAVDYVCDDTRIFDMQRAVDQLAKQLIDLHVTEPFRFKSGRFDHEFEGGQQGTTYRYKRVIVNVYEFQAGNGDQPMVTVLRCQTTRR